MHNQLVCGIAIGLLVSISTGAEKTNRLVGRVVDEKNRPLAGAKVLACEMKTKAQDIREYHQLGAAVTGADGRFNFDPWPGASPATVVATKEGRCLDWADWSSGQTGERILQLGRAATIEGEIVGEDGKPVAGASVDALLLLEAPRFRRMLAPFPGNTLAVRTDAQGQFRFANVPEGATVGFDVSAPGRARALMEPRFLPGQEGLRFVLPLEGRLEGVVVDKGSGQPLADVSLFAIRRVTSGLPQAWAKTDKQGRFSMAGLSGGKYRIQIVGAGQTLPEWLGSLEKVQVETGKVTSKVKMEASRGGTLELSLTDAATGESIAAAGSVHLGPAKDLRIGESGSTSNDGVARFYLAPGNYVVRQLRVTGYSYKPQKSKSFRVEVGKTERATLALNAVPQVAGALNAVPQVAGIVRDLFGRPVPGAKIQVLPWGGTPKDLVAGNDGRFAIDSADIPPSFCFISVRHPHKNWVAMEAVLKDVKLLEIALWPPAEVWGTVLDSQGRPIAGVSLQAQIGGSHLGTFGTMARARTDKAGRYQIELGWGLPYVITAKAPGYSTAEMVVPQHELVPGPAKVNLILRTADRVIRGVAQDPQGKPLPGVIVWAKSESHTPFPGAAVTDDKGEFALEHLSDDPVIYLFATVPGRGWAGSETVSPSETRVLIKVGP